MKSVPLKNMKTLQLRTSGIMARAADATDAATDAAEQPPRRLHGLPACFFGSPAKNFDRIRSPTAVKRFCEHLMKSTHVVLFAAPAPCTSSPDSPGTSRSRVVVVGDGGGGAGGGGVGGGGGGGGGVGGGVVEGDTRERLHGSRANGGGVGLELGGVRGVASVRARERALGRLCCLESYAVGDRDLAPFSSKRTP